MGQLTREERLALAVQAEVRNLRAAQVYERAALIQKRVQPLREGVGRFEELYGRRPDPKVPGELSTMLALSEEDGDDMAREQREAAARSSREIVQAEQEAIDAMEAVRTNLAPGMTTLEWIGVDAETYQRAVEQALKET
jgi:hypothetical protein